jgi:glycosyltransferase involved in cell wall biosynthesis
MTGLAEFLAASGARVTVLYTGEVSNNDFDHWRSRYADAGVALEWLGAMRLSRVVGPMARSGACWTNAWSVFEALRDRQFDVIHFNDTVGEGVFCLVAKRLGIAFQNTLTVLALHSPTEWILESNGHLHCWLGGVFYVAAERVSISATDLLWGPSQYLLSWIKERGYCLPEQVYRQQYVIPTDDLYGSGKEKLQRTALPRSAVEVRKPTEIVFFGRLEERKGIRLFASAITRLNDELTRRNISVLFMGKPNTIQGASADQFLAVRSAHWTFNWRVESSFDQQEAVAYLRENKCLAVMASPVDNSPCTVYEALQFGFPFIAADTGGIPELIDPDDHERHLFAYRLDALMSCIVDKLDNGIGSARPSVSIIENRARWLGMHKNWRALRRPATASAAAPRWGLIIEHSGSLGDLEATLGTARAQLREHLVATVVLRRELAPLGGALGAATLVLDELTDTDPNEALAWLRGQGVDALLVLRAGVEIAPHSANLLHRSAGSTAAIFLPAARIKSNGAVLPVIASVALAQLEGEYDAGGFVVSQAGLASLGTLLGPELDRNRLYMGLLELFLVADCEVWPLPEPILVLPNGTYATVVVRGDVTRMHAFVDSSRQQRYQMLAMGRHFYRLSNPTNDIPT